MRAKPKRAAIATQAKRKPGRPSKYTPELVQAICTRITAGEMVPAICEKLGITLQTICEWTATKPEFAEIYARAREARLQRWAEEIISISDTPVEGVKTEESKDGTKVIRGDMIDHRRLQVDTRKWMLARLARQLYGDRTALEHSGADGGPIVITVRRRDKEPG